MSLKELASDGLPMPSGDTVEREHPCSVLWAPIPMLSHLLPFVGHTMVTDSEGHLYDFAGHMPGSGMSGVLKDVGLFGSAVRVLRLEPVEGVTVARFREEWDRAVRSGNLASERMVHMAVVNNCHSHVCCSLRGAANVRRPVVAALLGWNIVSLACAMAVHGRWIPQRGLCFKVWCYIWALLMAAYFVVGANLFTFVSSRL